MNPLVPEGGLGLQRHRAARAPSTWRRCWPRTTRRACPRSASTGATCRTAATRPSRPTWRRSCCASPAAGIAVATMRGKSYLSLGGTSMGIAGSIVDPDFFEDYLGMRVEPVDMTEIVRRIEEGIYDEEELARALAWVKAHCREGRDYNAPGFERSARAEGRGLGDVGQDGADRARPDGRQPPARRRPGSARRRSAATRSSAGFQGQRHWTDHFPNGDFMEAILNSSFDWNGIREPFVFATENDSPERRRRCCSATCSRAPRRSSPTCARTGARPR